jgi:hypothetical protein
MFIAIGTSFRILHFAVRSHTCPIELRLTVSRSRRTAEDSKVRLRLTGKGVNQQPPCE